MVKNSQLMFTQKAIKVYMVQTYTSQLITY